MREQRRGVSASGWVRDGSRSPGLARQHRMPRHRALAGPAGRHREVGSRTPEQCPMAVNSGTGLHHHSVPYRNVMRQKHLAWLIGLFRTSHCEGTGDRYRAGTGPLGAPRGAQGSDPVVASLVIIDTCRDRRRQPDAMRTSSPVAVSHHLITEIYLCQPCLLITPAKCPRLSSTWKTGSPQRLFHTSLTSGVGNAKASVTVLGRLATEAYRQTCSRSHISALVSHASLMGIST